MSNSPLAQRVLRMRSASYGTVISMPNRWEITEYFRIRDALRSSPHKSKDIDLSDPLTLILEAVKRLLQNQQFRWRHSYGMVALALREVGLLDGSASFQGSLWITEDDELAIKQHQHKFIVLADGRYADPAFDLLVSQHKDPQRRFVKPIDPYPLVLADGLLAQFKDTQSKEISDHRDTTFLWFYNIVRRLQTRLSMSPDSSVWVSREKSDARRRSDFEALIGLCVDAFKVQSKDHWREYLFQALKRQWPVVGDSVWEALIERLELDALRPPIPQRFIYKTNKSFKPIDPSSPGRGGAGGF